MLSSLGCISQFSLDVLGTLDSIFSTEALAGHLKGPSHPPHWGDSAHAPVGGYSGFQYNSLLQFLYNASDGSQRMERWIAALKLQMLKASMRDRSNWVA